MQRVWSIFKLRRSGREAGFSPVEVLLAVTVFGFLVTAMIGAIVYGREGTARAGDRTRAVALAEEGLEAVRNIRDADFANLTNGTYGLVQVGNVWTLSGSSDTSGIYTRSVTISTVDSVRKTVASTVSWNSGNSQVSVSSRLTNWLAAMVTTSWAGAIVGGSADATGTVNGYKVATSGNYAYLIRNTGSPNFLVYDISTPASPSLVGSLTLAGNPTNVAVSGNYAYVSNSGDTTELQIVNVTTPASPSLAGTYNATGTGNGTSVGVRGTTVYLSRTSDTTTNAFELTLINVTTPASPTLVGGYNNNVNMNGVYVPASGNYVYLASASNATELIAVNITTPASPTLADTLDLSGTTDAATVAGINNTVFVGQGAAMRSVNVTTPTNITLISSVTPTGSGTVNDIAIEPTAAYAFIGTAATAAEFQVISIATPASMSVARVVDIAGTTSTLNGVSYNSTLDLVAGASFSDTQELVIFVKN